LAKQSRLKDGNGDALQLEAVVPVVPLFNYEAHSLRFSKRGDFQFLTGGGVNTKFGMDIVLLSLYLVTDMLCRFEMRAAENASDVEQRGQISHFLTLKN